jgi:sodium/bile acid cotransporter 7
MSCASVKKKIDENFIVIGILTVLTIGLLFPGPGQALQQANIQVGSFKLPQMAVLVIFFISGLTLQSPSDWKRPKPLAIGILYVLFLTPLLALPMMRFNDLGIGEVNIHFLQGLALFCAVPTTLSSGVAMVQQAGGNVPLALVLTTATNLLGVGTMPWTCSKIFSTTVTIDPMPMFKQLIFQTLVPLALGILARKNGSMDKFAGNKFNKWFLTKSQNCCIFLVVWLMTSGARDKILGRTPQELAWIFFLACVVHLVYRTGIYVIASASQLPGRDWVCLVIMCSQKSLPVCVSVLATLPADVQMFSGMIIVPCIMSHMSQLVIDGYLTQRWTIKDEDIKDGLLA